MNIIDSKIVLLNQEKDLLNEKLITNGRLSDKEATQLLTLIEKVKRLRNEAIAYYAKNKVSRKLIAKSFNITEARISQIVNHR